MKKVKRKKFIFLVRDDRKKLFKALCARHGKSMSNVLNDFIKIAIRDDTGELR